MHIPDGVNVDQKSDTGNNQTDQDGQRVNEKGKIYPEIAAGKPLKSCNRYAAV